MAATPTLLTAGTSVNASATTASVTPTSGRLLELDVIATRDSNAVGQTDLSVSGLGATWVLVAFLQYGTRRGIWRYRCESDGTSGTVDMTYAPGGQHAETGWALKQWSGQVTGGNGADAVGAPVSGTTFDTALVLGTVGALSAGDAASAVFGIESAGAAGAFEVSYAELVDQTGTNANMRQMLVGWDDTDVTASVTWTGSSSAGGVANRIIASTGGVSGTLAATEAADTLAASGSVAPPAITGSLAAVEDADALAAGGTFTAAGITGTVAVTEQPDILAASGTHTPPPVTGTLAVTEQSDTLAAGGIFIPEGISGSLTQTEAADMLTASGSAAPPSFTGGIAVTEQPDVLAAGGAVVIEGIAGNLAVTETGDTLATAGTSLLATRPGTAGALAPLVPTATAVAASGPTVTPVPPRVPTSGGVT